MAFPRRCLASATLLLWIAFSASAQSVVSTHAGLVHYFEGVVAIGGEPLTAQFGRFPEIPEGSELRTAQGYAEVLMGPGSILRVDQDSAIRLVSSSLRDARVELLAGTAMLESKDALAGNAVAVTFHQWQVRIPSQGVYRLDARPPELRVYAGEVEARAADGTPVIVKAGQTLPLAAVLVPEETLGAPGDGFNAWAFERREAIDADNATAAQIVDDPALYPNLADASGLAMAGYTYFPPVLTSPYTGYGSTYAYPLGLYGAGAGLGLGLGYGIRTLYPGMPGRVTLPALGTHLPGVGIYHPGVGLPTLRPVTAPPSIPHSVPAGGVHPGHH